MKGKNKLHLNQATMREIIQEWLNNTFKNCEVTGVVKSNEYSAVGFDTFDVTIEEVLDGDDD